MSLRLSILRAIRELGHLKAAALEWAKRTAASNRTEFETAGTIILAPVPGVHCIRERLSMVLDIATLDEKIERLRAGDTLTENEVKALCDKVRDPDPGAAVGMDFNGDPSILLG